MKGIGKRKEGEGNVVAKEVAVQVEESVAMREEKKKKKKKKKTTFDLALIPKQDYN